LIQDNFKLVQLSAKMLHARKKLSVLLKIDIARAFNLVAWAFLLELLQQMRFPSRWRDWVSALLSSASTKVLPNGVPGDTICHTWGLHQGDPLSPMLFLLIMEVLNALIHTADKWSLFKPLGVQGISHHASYYADDLALFVSPDRWDLHLVRHILEVFEKTSGLGCNMGKCQLAPIRCDVEQVASVLATFPCSLVEFPMKYLGIHLSVTTLPKLALQPLLDHTVDRLPIWKGHLLHRYGRLTLIKSTLSVIPIYTAISVALPPWFLKALRKLVTTFLWTGMNMVQVGKCLVAWSHVQRLLHLGGLGVLDLRLFSIAL
jgi:hypothetical protein